MESQIDLYDSEIPKIEEALRILNAHKARMGLGEFAEAAEYEMGIRGYKISLVWVFPDGTEDGMEVPHGMLEIFIAGQAGKHLPAPSPKMVIVGRVTPEREFDHERMTYEVQHDILGIDQPGALTKGGIITPPKSVSMHSVSKE